MKIIAVACLSFVVWGCGGSSDQNKSVPKPAPVAVIPGAAEIQVDDSVIVEKNARAYARIERAFKAGTIRKATGGGYEKLVIFNDAESGAEVSREWQGFDPMVGWSK